MANYINKHTMTEELQKYRNTSTPKEIIDKKGNPKTLFVDGIVTDKLHLMFMEMSKRLINKRGSLSFSTSGYSREYKEDMVSLGYMRCLTYGIKTYDVYKNLSPLAYFTQCIINEYKLFLKSEKKFQNRKWTELDRYVSNLEYDHQIQIELHEGIKERMYALSCPATISIYEEEMIFSYPDDNPQDEYKVEEYYSDEE